jgi:hypothetical protein
MTENQYRIEILSNHTNVEAAEILGVTQERARQLRLELLVPVHTYQITANRRVAEHKQAYEKVCSWTEYVPGRSGSRTWEKAQRYAVSRDLPWPPPNLPAYVPEREVVGKAAYEAYAQDNSIKWADVRTEVAPDKDTAAVREAADRYAQRHNLPWPLKSKKVQDQ